jgi:hypothetical protein
MSTNDKTRQKLLESMRKTKAGSGTSKTTVKSSNASGAKSTSSRARPATRSANKSNNKQTVKHDPYQSGRRVWPD